MNFRKWICIFVVTVFLCSTLIAGFNALTDPFGIFGDPLFNWYAYDMTQNPRAAKIGYLDTNFEKYDSYIIGCSKTSSYSTAALNRYYGDASFYNMLMYGGDMYDNEMTAKYILEHYNAKNIIINMGLEETASYNTEADSLKNNLHAKVDGSFKLIYYAKYLFANPAYAVNKIKAWVNDGYLVNANDVFVPKNGAYDKSARDVEPITNITDHIAANPSFKTVLKTNTLDAMDQCLSSIKRIKDMCELKGATFKLFISPMYHTEIDSYDSAQLAEFHTKLSQITDYWDFSGYHSVSYEPRYFYDVYHFKNAVGDMALARIFENDSLYLPDDFGHHVTEETVTAHLKAYFEHRNTADYSSMNEYKKTVEHSCEVPILMYHHLAKEPSGGFTVSPEIFEDQIAALRNAGYHAIAFSQLTDYVEKGIELPDNPIVITFDDGYRSNYEMAFPILNKYKMAATIHVIGVSVGKTTYKDTNTPITPHFSYAEGREMMESGLIDIQSHSYDMHNTIELDKDYRKGFDRKDKKIIFGC